MDELVYVLMGKAVYHNSSCSLLWGDDVWFGTSMTLKTAKNNELRPCSICHPEEGTQRSIVYQVSENGSYHTADCRIIWHSRFRTTLDKLPESARPCSHCHE